MDLITKYNRIELLEIFQLDFTADSEMSLATIMGAQYGLSNKEEPVL